MSNDPFLEKGIAKILGRKKPTSEESQKVFCIDCKHAWTKVYPVVKVTHCGHPTCFVDSPAEKDGKRVRDYEQMNAKNNCEHYSEK